jgi:hypothetical protein
MMKAPRTVGAVRQVADDLESARGIERVAAESETADLGLVGVLGEHGLHGGLCRVAGVSVPIC